MKKSKKLIIIVNIKNVDTLNRVWAFFMCIDNNTIYKCGDIIIVWNGVKSVVNNVTNNGNVLKNNEVEANKITAKIMLVTFYIMTVVLILNIVGIFVVPHKLMNQSR